MSSEQSSGVKLGGTIPIGLIATGAIAIGIIYFAGTLIKNFGGLGIFGGGKSEDKQQGGQSSDVEAQRAKASAEQQRAEAETIRAEASAVDAQSKGAQVQAEQSRADAEQQRANAEKQRADAESLRAEAEKSRAYNQRLLIESGQADKLGLLNEGNTATNTVTDKHVATATEAEKKSNTGTIIKTTPSGQSSTPKIDPQEAIKNASTQVKPTHNDTDPTANAINKANKKSASSNTNSKNKSVFLEDSPISVYADSGLSKTAKITGVVKAQGSQNTGDFVIFETQPRTLNDVIKQHPELTATEARNILLQTGTSSKKDIISLQEKAKTFDFGTNTGAGKVPLDKAKGGDIQHKDQITQTQISQSAKIIEEQKAKAKLEGK